MSGATRDRWRGVTTRRPRRGRPTAGARARAAAAVLLGAACLAATAAGAAEVYSNGTGGGLWSELGTWRAGTVPGPGDTAVIPAGDTVVFDRDDGAGTTCSELAIDPGGGLAFQPGGRRIMVLAGPLDAFGAIRLDATGGADDLMEIRLTGETREQRVIRVREEGSLLIYGRPGLADGARNAIVSCRPPVSGGNHAPGAIEAGDGAALDLQRVRIEDLMVQATGIDNTGGTANERLNVSDCRFEGAAHVVVSDCDTPAIVNNSFTYAAAATLAAAAITASRSPIAEIRGNAIRGAFPFGVMGRAQVDSTVQGNTFEKCNGGIYWYGTDAIFRDNSFTDCPLGVHCTSMSGLLENNRFDGCKIAIQVATAAVQVSGLTITNLQPDGLPIELSDGQVTLVNTDLAPGQVKFGGKPPTEGPWVETMQYLVVGIKGRAPAGAEVEVTTHNPPQPLPEGASDMNVRNSPAPVTARGSTPLPASLRALTVRGWSVAADGTLQPEPEYLVRLLAPPDAAAPGVPRRVIGQMVVKPGPAWRRATPTDAAPTVEIEVP